MRDLNEYMKDHKLRRKMIYKSFIYSFTSFTFHGYMVEFAELKAFPRAGLILYAVRIVSVVL